MSESTPSTPSSSPTPLANPRRTRLGRNTERRGVILGIVLISQLMVVLDATIVNIALPDISVDLQFSPASLSWVINAYTLAFGGLLLLGARAGDILGRRRVFLAGIVVFTVASLNGGLATSSTELLIARVLQGIGAALAAPSALAILMTLYSEGRERTRALGWFTAVSIGGSAVGLIVGGMLTQWANWRWVLFINVPIGVALVVLAMRLLPETPRRPGRFDLTGALTSTVGMGALVYSLVRATEVGWGDPITVIGLAVAVLLLGAFVATERRARSPITPLRLFADRNRAASYVVRLFLVAGMFGVFFFLTQFLQEVLRYSPVLTGLAFLPLTVALFVGSQASARVLTQRFGDKPVLLAGLLTSTAGLAWLSQLTAGSAYLLLLGPLVLFGLGNGLAFVPLTSVSLQGVRPDDAGAASGLVNVSQQLGGALGLAVLVTVFANSGGQAAAVSAAAYVHGADRVFAWASGFLAVGAVLTAGLIRRATKDLRTGEAPRIPEPETADRSSTLSNLAARPLDEPIGP